jgi:hypothetical protein
MTDSEKIECSIHGWQEVTFVCQHIVQSLHTGVAVGFHWPGENSDARPNAWCSACEKFRIEAGGDWTPEVEKKLGVKLLCGACYDHAKSIWAKGRNVTQ